jgi:hypothetical protein
MNEYNLYMNDYESFNNSNNLTPWIFASLSLHVALRVKINWHKAHSLFSLYRCKFGIYALVLVPTTS